MGFSLRIGSMLVTAETAAEAADLVRALGDVMPEPVKRPQGSGEIIETPSGWKIRARVAGERVSRAGFKSLGEAEAALVVLVDTGVAPPLKRHRRPKPPANDTTPPPAAPALPAPAPALPAPPALQKGTPEWRARVAEALRASWARRRAAAAEQTAPDPGASGFAASDEDGKQEVLAEPQDTHGLARLLLAKREPVESLDHLLDDDDEGTDLTDLVDVPDAEPTAIPDLNLGVECHACGQRGHIMSSPDCPLTTKPGWSPEAVRYRAEPRTRMPPSFTETPLTMHRHLHVIDLGAEPVDEPRPRTRGECQDEPRPCPFVSCRYHMALDVLETGNLHRTFGDMDLAEMPETCALDVADRDGATLEEIGRALNVSRERIRQIETLAIKSAKKNAKRLGLRFEAPDEKRTNAPEDTL